MQSGEGYGCRVFAAFGSTERLLTSFTLKLRELYNATNIGLIVLAETGWLTLGDAFDCNLMITKMWS